ncbi:MULTISPECIES: adenylyltransferase/cytidyltransferase family protein [Micromonospora]|uniref:RfaE bifunctional protein, domain II n=1 Tax=Micromonospora yangpuensis TaxID=683228 RepID=A0A1C6U0F1_9ACTN|nr:adenylyltransferase/cytidyltransferase family protein [Micromonospora yangpuensis]GGM11697.1 hypothetical protein GCM10012279_32270 [Micromonospora yangpuensis]SCL47552.1 rfaE bifunctional protein, domain II [Micromonospora yangpuensis]
MNRSPRSRLVDLPHLQSTEIRNRLGRISMAKGVYDLTHLGHVESLWMAREHGDSLVVALATDTSVRRRKGPGRPILTFRERVGILSSLTMIDYIVPYDDTNPCSTILAVRPSCFCATHFEYFSTADIAELRRLEIRLMQLPRPQERSTSDIIEDIRRKQA